ncbi:MAG: outer membrane beta-barrel protein [Gemmatimonadaceae bacterium]
MNAFCRFAMAAVSVALIAPPLYGQSFHLGLRGGAGIPTGAFADDPSGAGANDALVAGAKTGFGYGLDAGLGLGMFGIYAGFDNLKFDCETTTCTSDGKYKLAGVSAGIRLSPPGMSFIRPWIKGGVTFNELKGSYGSSSTSNGLTTDRAPGYEVGAGLDIPVFGFFALTPQVRYVGQNLKYQVPGVTSPTSDDEAGVNYFTVDLGLSLTNPLKSAKRR